MVECLLIMHTGLSSVLSITHIYTQKLKQHKWPKHITEWNYTYSLLKKTLRHSLKLMFQIIHLYEKIFLKMSSKYQKSKK